MNKTFYYQIAKRASQEIGDHPGLKYLKKATLKANNILDIGCGEGSRLNLMAGNKHAWGIDIDKYAVEQAKKQFPQHHFQTYEGKRLPYPDHNFDLVYSAFVLEHTTSPQKFIDEAIRVTKPGGKLVFLCPNFGAPNRRSPNSIESPLKKLIQGLDDDLRGHIASGLHWRKVLPKSSYEQIDDDTTVEPYLTTLITYLTSKDLEIVKASSLWELEPQTINARKALFSLLGKLGIYPFKFWGPQIFVAARKL